MTITISDLARAESMTDLKADKSAKVRGGIFGVSVTRVKQDIETYTQNAEANNGGIVAQAMFGDINMNFMP